MKNIRKFVAPEFIFGDGAIELVVRYAQNFGLEKPLIVSDLGVDKCGFTNIIREQLNFKGIESVTFLDISPNPRDYEVMSGAEVYRANNCDGIIAVGGGSPMDAAKAIGIVCTNDKNVLEFEGVDNVEFPGPPMICIPTTAGTSADVSQFAIINNTVEKKKFAIISKTMVPDVALIDPALCLTMDNYLTACTAIDALVHAIEAIASTANSPIMDIHAFEAIRLIKSNLITTLQNPNDILLRSNLSLASLEAGLAFSNASLGAVHAMAHSLGGYLDLPHGECNAILLNHIINFNYDASPERYDKIGENLGLNLDGLSSKERKQAIINDIIELKTNAGITNSFGNKGLKTADIPLLAENALKDPCLITNPRKANKRDLEALYEESI